MEFTIMELNKTIATPIGVRYDHNVSVIIVLRVEDSRELQKRDRLFVSKLN